MDEKKEIWLHRISHQREISYPLLENNYLSIGFSKLCNSEFIADTKNNKRASLIISPNIYITRVKQSPA